jgi:hypothetical protein
LAVWARASRGLERATPGFKCSSRLLRAFDPGVTRFRRRPKAGGPTKAITSYSGRPEGTIRTKRK